MFTRLGSRAKSPRRTTFTPRSDGHATTAPLPPLDSSITTTHYYAGSDSPTSPDHPTPWDIVDLAPGTGIPTSPKASSTRRSAPTSSSGNAPLPHGLSGSGHHYPAGINGHGAPHSGAPWKKGHSPESSLSYSTGYSGASILSSIPGTPLSAISSSGPSDLSQNMPAKTSRSFLGRKKNQAPAQKPAVVEDEFDPTTFRKRPNGPRGANAVYQEYDDLFNDDDDDDEEDEEEEEERENYKGHDAGQRTESNDDFLLLQIDEKPKPTMERKATTASNQSSGSSRPRFSRSSSYDRQQPPPTRLFPRGGSFNSSSPPRSTSRGPPPTSSPIGNPSIFPPHSAKSWHPPHHGPPFNTTTPPRSTAPSVDEPLDPHPLLPLAVGAPPTPPLPSSFSNGKQTFLSIDTNPGSNDDLPNLHRNFPTPPPHRNPPTPPPSSLPRTQSSDQIKTQDRIIPENLGVDIPSPTLFMRDSWLPASAKESADVPSYSPLQPTTYQPTSGIDETMRSASTSSLSSAAFSRPPMNLRIDTSGSGSSSETGTIKISTSSSSLNRLKISASSSSLSHLPRVQLSGGNRKSGRSSTSSKNSMESIEGDFPHSTAVTSAPRSRSNTVTSTGLAEKTTGGLEEADEDGIMMAVPGKDTAHLRAFRNFIKASGSNDPFVSRGPRYDAFQAQRICPHPAATADASITTPTPAPAPGKRARASSIVTTVKRDPAEEIMTGLWTLMALRWLQFGKILISPAHGALLAASKKTLERRATLKKDDRARGMLDEAASIKSPNSRRTSVQQSPWSPIGHERRRVLDLGGQPVADWGWHCAFDYPSALVYTVTTPSSTPPPPSTLRGPRNHRHIPLPSLQTLTALPFPSNHFDVISARSLHSLLPLSLFPAVLSEIFRVLKPGGYFEFNILDADIVNPGPEGEKLSERFTERLRETDRDPYPTRRWMGRLQEAGFVECKRAWIVLPMAPKKLPKPAPAQPDEAAVEGLAPAGVVDPKEEIRRRMKSWEVENEANGEGVEGTTRDVAGITGLVGGVGWEKWILGAGMREEALVGKVMEEAKEKGSGWRCLNGFGRKAWVVGEEE